jgi:[Skp1-protein]-hydroxyproline N-acetylglucosaminyltransferase
MGSEEDDEYHGGGHGGDASRPSNNVNASRTKRLRKRRTQGGLSSYWPTKIVCSATSRDATGNVVVEWGVILVITTLALWMLGFMMTLSAVPYAKDRSVAGGGVLPLNLANPSEQVRNLGVAGGEDAAAAAAAVTDSDGKKRATVPASAWPVSLRSEDLSTYDTIIHPGDGVSVMQVPPFWSAPIHGNKLMTRPEAMRIGSCIESPDPDNHSIGEKCPLHQRTIYVGIASYRDFECRSTVESIFLRAKYPERIRVGVVDQIVNGEDPICNAPIHSCDDHPDQALCKYANQVDVYEMKAELSIGPVFARHIGYRIYRGEFYATQSDAHVTYTQGWDVDIIDQLESTHNDMAVLTTYLTDVQGSISPEGNSLRDTRPIMCNTIYEGGAQGMHLRHGSQPERVPTIQGSPQLQPWWAAGYSFSRGHFVVNVPYDWMQPMIFQGEEMSIGIRGYTVGYDYYAPERSVCFHHYAVGNNARVRGKVHHFWENDNKYAGTGRKAMKRLLGIVHMNPEDPADSWDHADENIYGVGGVRTPENFYKTFGINVVDKTVEGHLCRFVDAGGKMHKEFTPYLRSDGMGIDYTKINFQFKDPEPAVKEVEQEEE